MLDVLSWVVTVAEYRGVAWWQSERLLRSTPPALSTDSADILCPISCPTALCPSPKLWAPSSSRMIVKYVLPLAQSTAEQMAQFHQQAGASPLDMPGAMLQPSLSSAQVSTSGVSKSIPLSSPPRWILLYPWTPLHVRRIAMFLTPLMQNPHCHKLCWLYRIVKHLLLLKWKLFILIFLYWRCAKPAWQDRGCWGTY